MHFLDQQFPEGLCPVGKVGGNLLSWFAIPRKRRTSPTFVGAGTLCLPMTLFGLGLIPSNDLSQKRELLLSELTFLDVHCHTCILEPVENLVKAFIMFFLGFTMDQDAIDHADHHSGSRTFAAESALEHW